MRGYVVAVATVAIGRVLSYAFYDFLVPVPFLLFLVGVVLSALVGGRGPGFLAAILGGVVATLLFLPSSFSRSGIDLTAAGRLAAYLAVSVILVVLTGHLRGLRERAAEADRVRARTAAIVESSQDAILVKGLDTTITDWNPAAERLYGYSAAEAIGRSVALTIPPERLDELDEIMTHIWHGRRVETLETIRRRKDGSLVAVAVTVSPVKDATGRVVGASVIARDISEQKRAHERLSFLLEAIKHLSNSLDYERTLQTVAALTVPRLADWCFVDVVEGGRLDAPSLAVAHVDPAKVRWARELQERYPPIPTRLWACPTCSIRAAQSCTQTSTTSFSRLRHRAPSTWKSCANWG